MTLRTHTLLQPGIISPQMSIRACVVGLFLLAIVGLLAQSVTSTDVWARVYTSAQAERGAFAYTRYCQRCHGADLNGSAMGGHLPGQSPAPPLAGDEFNWSWNGTTVADLVRRIRSMPPGNPSALSAADSADVMAFILSKGGFPPGDAELPATLPELQQIAFNAVKP